jgi:hypothetical protein
VFGFLCVILLGALLLAMPLSMKEGSDITIVATGLMVNEAVQAAETLAAEGISARVVNIHTIKPLDKELICKCAKETGVIVTAEEHSIIGGLGSAVAESVTECCPVPVVKIGVNDEFGHSGPAVDLLKEFGLSAENIVKTVKEAVKLAKDIDSSLLWFSYIIPYNRCYESILCLIPISDCCSAGAVAYDLHFHLYDRMLPLAQCRVCAQRAAVLVA